MSRKHEQGRHVSFEGVLDRVLEGKKPDVWRQFVASRDDILRKIEEARTSGASEEDILRLAIRLAYWKGGLDIASTDVQTLLEASKG